MRPDLPPHRRPVNTVFQKYALFPHLNVFDNIAFGLKLKNTPKDAIVQKVKNALRMVNYSPQATAACHVATADAMWLLTDFLCLYCRLKPRYDLKRPSLREIFSRFIPLRGK